jgi:hypothetical protein
MEMFLQPGVVFKDEARVPAAADGAAKLFETEHFAEQFRTLKEEVLPEAVAVAGLLPLHLGELDRLRAEKHSVADLLADGALDVVELLVDLNAAEVADGPVAAAEVAEERDGLAAEHAFNSLH